MKSLFLTLLMPATLAGTLVLSGCSAWHTTGEMQIGDMSPVVKSPGNQDQPGGITAPPQPPTGNAARKSAGAETH